jgi:hypothetical protein
MKIKFVLLLFTLTTIACISEGELPIEDQTVIKYTGTSEIKSSFQRTGNPVIGKQYLYYGDSLSSGIPYDLFRQFFPADYDLDRIGDNKNISYKFTAHNYENGVKVVSPNCMTCHAESLNDKVILGLGNNTSDYTIDQSASFNSLEAGISFVYGKESKEEKALKQFSASSKAIGKFVITKTRGVNPADKVFAILAAHRSPSDLSWNEKSRTTIPTEVIPTDVPAWWLLKKKNALYYNGLGVGDFSRLSSASGLLTMKDSSEARVLDNQMIDIIAFIKTINPPPYPQVIDISASAKGEKIFIKNCSYCHGKYGSESSYPNLLVSLKTIGTDPALANAYKQHPEYNEWYNQSWYNKNPGQAFLNPTDGYLAPPLDGIWATAPYLHNGSVPTLEELLNSKTRPKIWQRNFDNKSYNYAKLGWNYNLKTSKDNSETYDTSITGYGNGGHTFGDALKAEDRKNLLEYLKSL